MLPSAQWCGREEIVPPWNCLQWHLVLTAGGATGSRSKTCKVKIMVILRQFNTRSLQFIIRPTHYSLKQPVIKVTVVVLTHDQCGLTSQQEARLTCLIYWGSRRWFSEFWTHDVKPEVTLKADFLLAFIETVSEASSFHAVKTHSPVSVHLFINRKHVKLTDNTQTTTTLSLTNT